MSRMKEPTDKQKKAAILREINAFENAKNKSGQLLHPYFPELFGAMLYVINVFGVDSVKDAYKHANRLRKRFK